MKEEPIYRVRVEVIGEENDECKIDKKLLEGVECNGFTLIADHDSSATVVACHITTYDIAQGIACSDTLMRASVLAKALREAKRYEAEGKKQDLLKTLLDNMED